MTYGQYQKGRAGLYDRGMDSEDLHPISKIVNKEHSLKNKLLPGLFQDQQIKLKRKKNITLTLIQPDPNRLPARLDIGTFEPPYLFMFQRIHQNRAIRSIYRLEWCSPVGLTHEISGLSLIKDRLTNLGKRYIGIAEGRSELMKHLVSELCS
jgi:hypothetical protein